uniref:Uncharacterized protein n=1 Tax=Lepeophtheirus salmonis TaxID=72036 RepID=A0A0K2V0B4_LEPSM
MFVTWAVEDDLSRL